MYLRIGPYAGFHGIFSYVNGMKGVLVLTESDLRSGASTGLLPNLGDFRSGVRGSFLKASLVLYMEKDWTAKVLKNRYGPPNDYGLLQALSALK